MSSTFSATRALTLTLLGLTVVDALVRGGSITIAVERRDLALELAIRGAGPRVVIDPASTAMFDSMNDTARSLIF